MLVRKQKGKVYAKATTDKSAASRVAMDFVAVAIREYGIDNGVLNWENGGCDVNN